MAPAAAAFSPQLWPRLWKKASATTPAATAAWRMIEPKRFLRRFSSAKFSSGFQLRSAAMGSFSRVLLVFDRTGDDADVGDSGLLDGIHHRSERAEGDALVGAKVDDALGRIARGAEPRGKLIDVDGLVLQEDVLLAVDGDDHAFVGDLIDGAGLRDGDVD